MVHSFPTRRSPDLGPLAFVARALGDEVDRPVVDVQDLLVDDTVDPLGVALLLGFDLVLGELSDRLLAVGVRYVVVPEQLQWDAVDLGDVLLVLISVVAKLMSSSP